MVQGFSKKDYFKLGSVLQFFLQQNDILSSKERRIVALTMLFELYRNETILITTFSGFFIQILNSSDNVESSYGVFSKLERNFISKLMSGLHKDLLKKTAKQIVNSDLGNENLKDDHAKIQVEFADFQSELPCTIKSSIPVTISCPTNEGYNGKKETIRDLIERLTIGNQSVIFKSYCPDILMKEPPLLECENELKWLFPLVRNNLKISYDESMLTTDTIIKEPIKAIMQKAYKSALTSAQQNTILNEFENNTKIIYHLGLTPSKLPDLIEHNPTVAIHLIQRLMQTPQITEYLLVLVNMELSLHSMEVVNRLTTKVGLPSEFVHLYISNCIRTCENLKEKYMQNRFVRLVCVFIQSLIRSKTIKFQEINMELQGFCVEFSRIREAASLYRLLKQIESEESESNSQNISENK